ncbi:MAG: outer membrane protein transport protein [candidate division KSB1 bacterium]|nr:outer membrane protein transport protein [candidate division KSB1 bacterium]MDZ7301872.1 outer membrane protein transport protein [candidate division KSB1 bacterium]MDZ7310255.1 outer membrane protein transport protein [candidate division KSB1 bacterium]
MKRKLMAFGILVSLFGWQSIASAQEEVFQRGVELGIGARSMGMGGAYIGIADDYSASFWNPAGLTQIRRLEGFGTLSHTQRKNDASFGSLSSVDELSTTRFNSIGLAYPVPTYRGSLVFSLGYHRIKPFDSSMRFEYVNMTPGDSVTQRWSELEEGSLNNWVFAGAVEVAPNFSLGAALNIWSGKDDYQFSFVETDLPFDLYTLNKYRKDNDVSSSFSGYNLKIGGFYRPISNFRLGFTIGTPVTYTIKDEWRTSEVTTFDNPQTPAEEYSDNGKIEYKIRSPFSFGAGASLNVANLLLAASIENNDWSQIRYVTDPPIEGLSKNEANEELARKYRNTLRYHLGAELTLPLIDLQLRGGYYYEPTPLGRDYFAGGRVPKDANREFFTAGVGVFLDKQVRLDVGVMTGQWHDYKDPLTDFADDNDDDVPLAEKITFNKIFAALAFRF